MGLLLFVFAILGGHDPTSASVLLWGAWLAYLIFHDCERRTP